MEEESVQEEGGGDDVGRRQGEKEEVDKGDEESLLVTCPAGVS